VSQFSADQSNHLKVVAKASDTLGSSLNGWNSIEVNPVQDSMFATCSKYFSKSEQAPLAVKEGEEAVKLGSI